MWVKQSLTAPIFGGIWGNGLYYSTYKNGDDWWPIQLPGGPWVRHRNSAKTNSMNCATCHDHGGPWRSRKALESGRQLTWRLGEVPAKDGKIIGKNMGKALD